MTEFLDFNDRVLSDIRAAADIVEVIGDHTALKKAGKSWKGLCPFHSEKTPSFTVDRDRGLFYCFGCGAGGDLFGFVRQIERVEFREAAEILARRYGVEVPRRSRRPDTDRREALSAAVRSAHRLFIECLGRKPNAASDYLKTRGVPEETAKELELGFAPDAWDTVARGLSQEFTPELMIEAGLLQPGSEGKRPYDRFRNRLIFPLKDERGRCVGFGGRCLSPEEEPKYLNSPESPIFSKNRTLYGLPTAREAMKASNRAVLVEGYFDHLGLHLSGLAETVATMGTALSPPQAERLRRLVSRVVLCYDGDEAGRRATARAIPILLSSGLEVSVAHLPKDLDPYDLYRDSGAPAVRQAIENAPGFLEWLLGELAPVAQGLTAAQKGERVNAIRGILGAVPDRVVRYEHFRRLAAQVSVPVELLWTGAQARGPAEDVPGTNREEKPLRPLPAPEVERRLLKALLEGGPGREGLLEAIEPEILTDSRARALLKAIQGENREQGRVDVGRVLGRLADASERAFLSEVALAEGPVGTDENSWGILRGLKKRLLDRRAESLQQAIEAAEKKGDREEVTRLYNTKLALMRERQDLARGGKRAEH
jgi:DNA primase